MAEHAQELVKANKLQDVVEVIQGSVEDIVLPEKGYSYHSSLFPLVYEHSNL